MSEPLALTLPDTLVEKLAERAAELVLVRLKASSGAGASPYLTVAEAAEYLRAKPQRIYDLLSARRLTRYKDGSRVLVSREELAAQVLGTRVAPPLPHRPSARSASALAQRSRN